LPHRRPGPGRPAARHLAGGRSGPLERRCRQCGHGSGTDTRLAAEGVQASHATHGSSALTARPPVPRPDAA
jgi:hypothetical protein